MVKSIFSTKALLAPMAGITDIPFRLIARTCGLGFAFTEMLAVKPLLTYHKRSTQYIQQHTDDSPLGAQIVGRDPKLITVAIKKLTALNIFSVIDINCGCPVKKVVAKGEGAALLREPKQLKKIISSAVRATHLPITCKIRTGWSRESKNALDIAQIIEDCGAHAIFVHGRTKEDGYRGDVDLKCIAQIKRRVSIPVIGNGNIFSLEDARKMFEYTGCDHVLIARGALGNPWIFREIETNTIDDSRNDITNVKETLFNHARLLLKWYDEKKAILLLRKVGCWYFKGFSHKGPYRVRMNSLSSIQDFYEIIDSYVSGYTKV